MTKAMQAQRSAHVHGERIAYEKRLNEITDVEYAWFTGWLCADGSILDAGGGRPRIRFTITDIDPLDKFAKLFGNSVVGPLPPSGLGVKDRYSWDISGWKASLIIARVKPWLSSRYAARADALSGFKPAEHHGQKLTPAQVADIRDRLADGGHGIGRKLAQEYGVSCAMISSIKVGRSWPLYVAEEN